ncbi:unnamed protein product [Closterium sp. NIES-65]|nr:unnamed protein product [Closterium sp. NIES-65]
MSFYALLNDFLCGYTGFSVSLRDYMACLIRGQAGHAHRGVHPVCAEQNTHAVKEEPSQGKLGTLTGVYIPCVQNILGIIFYIRLSWWVLACLPLVEVPPICCGGPPWPAGSHPPVLLTGVYIPCVQNILGIIFYIRLSWWVLDCLPCHVMGFPPVLGEVPPVSCGGGVPPVLLTGVYVPCVDAELPGDHQDVHSQGCTVRIVGIAGVSGSLMVVAVTCASTFITALSLSAVVTNGAMKYSTCITALSVSAVITNDAMKGGGPYYLIGRALGPEVGVSIGLCFFFGNAIGGSLYILGSGNSSRRHASNGSLPTFVPYILGAVETLLDAMPQMALFPRAFPLLNPKPYTLSFLPSASHGSGGSGSREPSLAPLSLCFLSSPLFLPSFSPLSPTHSPGQAMTVTVQAAVNASEAAITSHHSPSLPSLSYPPRFPAQAMTVTVQAAVNVTEAAVNGTLAAAPVAAETVLSVSRHDMQAYGIITTICLCLIVFGGVHLVDRVGSLFIIPALMHESHAYGIITTICLCLIVFGGVHLVDRVGSLVLLPLCNLITRHSTAPTTLFIHLPTACPPPRQAYGIITTICLCLIVFGGVHLVDRVGSLFIIPAVLAVISVFIGIFLSPDAESPAGLTGLSTTTLFANWLPSYQTTNSNGIPDPNGSFYWGFNQLLGLFNPGVTGIMPAAGPLLSGSDGHHGRIQPLRGAEGHSAVHPPTLPNAHSLPHPNHSQLLGLFYPTDSIAPPPPSLSPPALLFLTASCWASSIRVQLLGLFYPGVTGIMAGSNRSEALRDTQRSIPTGTLAAIVSMTGLYVVSILLFGAVATRDLLVTDSCLALLPPEANFTQFHASLFTQFHASLFTQFHASLFTQFHASLFTQFHASLFTQFHASLFTQFHASLFTQFHASLFTQFHASLFTQFHASLFTQFHASLFTQFHASLFTQFHASLFTQFHASLFTQFSCLPLHPSLPPPISASCLTPTQPMLSSPVEFQDASSRFKPRSNHPTSPLFTPVHPPLPSPIYQAPHCHDRMACASCCPGVCQLLSRCVPAVVQMGIVLSTLGAAAQNLVGPPRLVAAIATPNPKPQTAYEFTQTPTPTPPHPTATPAHHFQVGIVLSTLGAALQNLMGAPQLLAAPPIGPSPCPCPSLLASPLFFQVGIVLSTLGAALQNLMGAPRLLAAIANDNVLPVLNAFKAESHQEPHLATLFTLLLCCSVVPIREVDYVFPVITMFFLLCCYCKSHHPPNLLIPCLHCSFVLIGDVDYVSPVITMFFLLCYCGVNLSCALLDLVDAPSWRPRWRWHHWLMSLAGALLCLGTFLHSHPRTLPLPLPHHINTFLAPPPPPPPPRRRPLLAPALALAPLARLPRWRPPLPGTTPSSTLSPRTPAILSPPTPFFPFPQPSFIMYLISWFFTLVCLTLAVLIYIYVSMVGKAGDWGDGVKSAYMQLALRSLHFLGDWGDGVKSAYMQLALRSLHFLGALVGMARRLTGAMGSNPPAYMVHPKNWYPIPLILCKPWGLLPPDAPCHPRLGDFAKCMRKKGRGMSIFVSVLEGNYSTLASEASRSARCLLAYIDSNQCEGVAEVMVASSVRRGVGIALQSMGLAGLKPNIVCFRYPEAWQQQESSHISATFVSLINDSNTAGKACVIVKGLDEWPAEGCGQYGTIDLFWIVRDGGIMLLLSQLLRSRPTFDACKIQGCRQYGTINLFWIVRDGGIMLLLSQLLRSRPTFDACKIQVNRPKGPAEGCRQYGTIDLFWIVRDGGIMLLLSQLLRSRPTFDACKIQVFCIAEDNGTAETLLLDAAQLIVDVLRIPLTHAHTHSNPCFHPARLLPLLQVFCIAEDDGTAETLQLDVAQFLHDLRMQVSSERSKAAQSGGGASLGADVVVVTMGACEDVVGEEDGLEEAELSFLMCH